MANPNMLNVANITGQTALLSTNSTYANLVVNNTGSNSIVRINTITVTNYSNANFLANVDIYRSSTSYPIVGNVVVPANSTFIVTAKDTPYYLQEGDTVRAATGANGIAISSYDIVS